MHEFTNDLACHTLEFYNVDRDVIENHQAVFTQ